MKIKWYDIFDLNFFKTSTEVGVALRVLGLDLSLMFTFKPSEWHLLDLRLAPMAGQFLFINVIAVAVFIGRDDIFYDRYAEEERYDL